MQIRSRSILAGVCTIVAALMLSGVAVGDAEGRFGGQLVVALESDPPMLDMQYSNQNLVRWVASHMNEQLYTFGEDFRPVPMLAEGHTISDDGRVYTIALRQGVTFHNGQEMTSEDVLASLQRWFDLSTVASSIEYNVVSVTAPDRYTIEIELAEPMGFIIDALSTMRQGAAVYPKSVIDATAEGDRITEYIGTGPYEFVEWREGSHILLRRYEDYAIRDEPPLGYGGGRTAYLDEIRFVFVADAAVRAVGLEAGDFHFADPLSPDDFPRLDRNPDIEHVQSPWMMTLNINKAMGPTADVNVRRALLAAIDAEELLMGVHGDPAFWRLDPAIMWQESAWWTDVGADRYNQADPERARQLLDEAGYDGEPVRMAVSATQAVHYNASLILREQLRQAGFNIQVDEYDLATHRATTPDPTRWEISPGQSSYREHPTMHLHMDRENTGWWENDEKEELQRQLLIADDPDEALALWEQIQELYYDDVPIVKIGDFFRLGGRRTSVQGFADLPELFFWNVWLEE